MKECCFQLLFFFVSLVLFGISWPFLFLLRLIAKQI